MKRIVLPVLLLAVLFALSSTLAQADAYPLNVLTPNQASVAWDTGGFRGATGGGTTPTLLRDTAEAWEGDASLQVQGDGSATRQGIWMASTFVPDNRATYTFSGYIKGKEGDEFFITYEEKSEKGTGVIIEHAGENFKITGSGWQRFSFTHEMEVGNSLGITVRHAADTPFKFWLDGLQLEMGKSASPWQMPVINKNLVLYNEATVEVDTRGFIPATGGGTPTWLSKDSSKAWEGNSSLKVDGDGSAAGQGVWMWPPFVPDTRGTYTFTAYIQGTPGDEFYLAVEEKKDMGTGLVRSVKSDPFALGEGWQRKSITITMEEGARINLVLRHAKAEPFKVWVDGVQLEQGDTASAWESPVKF